MLKQLKICTTNNINKQIYLRGKTNVNYTIPKTLLFFLSLCCYYGIELKTSLKCFLLETIIKEVALKFQ